MEKIKDIYETITMYRYISLVITSICYLTNVPQQSIYRKLLIITMMVLSALLMNYLYKSNRENKSKILILVIIEVIGDSLLIIPSGGIYSPYIWYVFNTVLIAGVELKKDYVQVTLMIYMICIMILSNFFPHKMHQEIVGTQYTFNMAIGIIFAGLIVQVVSNYAKEIEKQKDEVQSVNKQLEEAGLRAEDSLNWLMDTYEVINFFAIYNTKDEMVNTLLNYIVNVLQFKQAAFIENTDEAEPRISYTNGMSELDRKKIIGLFKHAYKEHKTRSDFEGSYYPLNDEYLCLMVECSYKEFGCIIVAAKEITHGLIFIKQLSDLLFKKLNLETIEEEMLINQEQNRIANEIHDSILQQLFGVGCNLFTLEKKIEKLEKEDIGKAIKYNRQTINTAMTELRKIIYGMSWNKEGVNQLLCKIEGYIEGVKRLYEVEIDFKVIGNVQDIDIKMQGAIYRIICEGLANSLRHGKATQLSVSLKITLIEVRVEVIDNGIGFDYLEVRESKKAGLGIKNIEELAGSLGGEVEITSRKGKGTRVEISIPVSHLKEGVVE